MLNTTVHWKRDMGHTVAPLATRIQQPLVILLICVALRLMISFLIARLGGYPERRWSPNE